MITTAQPAPTTRAPMDGPRRTAVVAGALYLVTFAASIPTLGLKGPMHEPDYVTSSGSDSGVLLAGVLDVVTGLAGLGTAIALFTVVRRRHEGLALGFVASRTLEAALLFVSAVSVFALVTLRQGTAGAGGTEAAARVAAGDALVAVHDWSFLAGPGIVPAVNAVFLATALYRTGLVPRVIPLLGLVGAPVLVASAMGTVFGVYDQISVWTAIATIPIFCWELSLGLWLVLKGFTPSPDPTGTSAGTAPANHGADA